MAYKPLEQHKHGEPIVWNERRWFVNNRGYYMDREGVLLHREVWKAHNGPIPEGGIIHHKDENKLNFDISNLELVSSKQHVVFHPRHEWNEQQRETISEHLKKRWANPKLRTVKCVGCGAEFESTGMRAMFCSRVCRRRYYTKYRGY